MKISEKYSPSQLERPAWSVYTQCELILGHVLDDKFDKPHVHVYEHARHTFDEMFYHPPMASGPTRPDEGSLTALAAEEKDVLDLLRLPEDHRRLTLVGDIGVGKTTFLKHLMELHFNTEEYGCVRAIYLDWKAFTAPVKDPLPAIYRRFVHDIYASLEREFGTAKLVELDDRIVLTAPMFAPVRSLLARVPRARRGPHITKALENALVENPVELAYERLNMLCVENRNALVLVIDNIDQLHPAVLDHFFQFLVEVQTRTTPLVIVAMRDHTFDRGFSAYRREGTTLSWFLRLRAPNVRSMLERRLEYFLPKGSRRKDQVRVLVRNVTVQQDTGTMCRALLEAPFRTAKGYEFLIRWCNYNIRELFRILQEILCNSAFSGLDKDVVFARPSSLRVGMDECVIAMALGNYLMFYPHKSIVFNPYSAGLDAHPCDRIVAIRVLQYLMHRKAPVGYLEMMTRFKRWGYSVVALEAQLLAMANKDVLWTNAGPPTDVDEKAEMRLSYRGEVYVGQLLERAVFNYLMSFDVHAPNERHSIARHHTGELRQELENIGTFDRKIDAGALADRVLG